MGDAESSEGETFGAEVWGRSVDPSLRGSGAPEFLDAEIIADRLSAFLRNGESVDAEPIQPTSYDANGSDRFLLQLRTPDSTIGVMAAVQRLLNSVRPRDRVRLCSARWEHVWIKHSGMPRALVVVDDRTPIVLHTSIQLGALAALRQSTTVYAPDRLVLSLYPNEEVAEPLAPWLVGVLISVPAAPLRLLHDALALVDAHPQGPRRAGRAVRTVLATGRIEAGYAELGIAYTTPTDQPITPKIERSAARRRRAPVTRGFMHPDGLGRYTDYYYRCLKAGTVLSGRNPTDNIRTQAERAYVNPARAKDYTRRARYAIRGWEACEQDPQRFVAWLELPANSTIRHAWVTFTRWLANQQNVQTPELPWTRPIDIRKLPPTPEAALQAISPAPAPEPVPVPEPVVESAETSGIAETEAQKLIAARRIGVRVRTPKLPELGTRPRYIVSAVHDGTFFPPDSPDVVHRRNTVHIPTEQARAFITGEPTTWAPIFDGFSRYLNYCGWTETSTRGSVTRIARLIGGTGMTVTGHTLPIAMVLAQRSSANDRWIWNTFVQFTRAAGVLRLPYMRPGALHVMEAMPSRVVEALLALAAWNPTGGKNAKWPIRRLLSLTAWHIQPYKGSYFVLNPNHQQHRYPPEKPGPVKGFMHGAQVLVDDMWMFDALLAWRDPKPGSPFDPCTLPGWDRGPLKHSDPFLVPYPGVPIRIRETWYRDLVQLREIPRTNRAARRRPHSTGDDDGSDG